MSLTVIGVGYMSCQKIGELDQFLAICVIHVVYYWLFLLLLLDLYS